MTRNILFLDRAIRDIEKAYDWYEEQQVGLGKQFKKSIDDITLEIANFHLHSLISIRYQGKL